MLYLAICLLLVVTHVSSFVRNNIAKSLQSPTISFFTLSKKLQSSSNTRLYYDYLNDKNEKKEIGRIIKNIIFPGIYREYEDTKEVKKTIIIDTKKNIIKKSRNEGKKESYKC